MILAGTAGYCLPKVAQEVSVHIGIFIFVIMFCMGLTTTPERLKESIFNIRGIVIFLCLSFGLAPVLSWILGRIFFPPTHGLFVGCILVGCTSTTISSAIVYTRLSSGNNALSLILSNIGNLAGVFLTPLLIFIFLGKGVKIPVVPMIINLTVLVLLPVILAQVLRRFFTILSKIEGLTIAISQLGVLMIVFGSVGKSKDLIQFSLLFKLVLISIILYILILRFSSWFSLRCKFTRPDSIAIGFASSQKTLASTILLAHKFFIPLASLPIIAYHITQMLLGSWDIQRFKKAEKISK